jgi:hypothetical protein
MELPTITVVSPLFIPNSEGGFSCLMGAKQTIISWARHLHYAGQLRIHLVNDSVDVPEGEIAKITDFSSFETTISHTHGRGVGGALNEGIRTALSVSPLILMTDDSYSLIEDVDLTPWATALMRHEDIGAVSLMPPRPGQTGGEVLYIYDIRTEGLAGIVFHRHAYAWNGRPMLYAQRWFNAYGWFLENVSGYELEREYAERYVNTPGPPVLYAFLDPFQHVWSGVRLGDKPPGWDGK